MEETERSCWEVQSHEDKSGSSQGSKERAGWWGSSSVLTSVAFSLLRKLALCPLRADPVYSAALMSLLRGRKSQLLQGLVLLAKRKAGDIEIIWSATHTYSSPNNNKRQELYKTTWLSDPRLLGDRESPYPVVGSTGNPPWEQLCTLCTS